MAQMNPGSGEVARETEKVASEIEGPQSESKETSSRSSSCLVRTFKGSISGHKEIWAIGKSLVPLEKAAAQKQEARMRS